MKLQVKPVTKSSAAVFAKLIREAIAAVPQYPSGAIASEQAVYSGPLVVKRMKSKRMIQLLAWDGKKPVGAVFGSAVAGVAWLDWIGTSKTFRRRGVGRLLVRVFEREAKNRGHHKVWLNTETGNNASQSLFLACGYKKVGVVRHHWYNTDNILWDKIIDRPKSYARK